MQGDLYRSYDGAARVEDRAGEATYTHVGVGAGRGGDPTQADSPYQQTLQQTHLQQQPAATQHPPHCQCLSCKLDHYKQEHGEAWTWSFISRDYSSIALGAAAGSLVTLLGVVLFKQWRSAGFGSLASSTPSIKTLSPAPMVIVNNATEPIHNVITVDPSVGIIYTPTTAIYEIDLTLNLVLGDSVTTNKVVQLSIVKNGLPTDSAAVLFSVEQGLQPGLPQVVSMHGFRVLKSEDYIQVFAITQDGTTFPVTILNFDFTMKLSKVQKDGG